MARSCLKDVCCGSTGPVVEVAGREVIGWVQDVYQVVRDAPPLLCRNLRSHSTVSQVRLAR